MLPRFRCITMDPPWPEHGGCNRGADAHYGTVPVPEMPRIITRSPLWRLESSCHLWCWATVTHLVDALWLVGNLGFRYVTHFVWVKLHEGKLELARKLLSEAAATLRMGYASLLPRIARVIAGMKSWVADVRELLVPVESLLQVGLGQYIRGAHEICLLATKGKAMVPPPEHRYPSVLFAPRRAHSAKPVEAIERFEAVSPGPRAELFGRQPRDRWFVWGNEIEGGVSVPEDFELPDVGPAPLLDAL